MKLLVASVLLAALVSIGDAKIFGKCELANTLKGLGFPTSEIPTWLCICSHESNFNTDATNNVTGDHGIFQISQIYWCSTSNTPGGACNKRCADFHDNNINDDAACVRTIFNEWVGMGRVGFDAWTTYRAYCNGDNSAWMNGC